MNRAKKKRDIKYQKLYECSLLEQDDYWKQFFENISRGKSVKKLILNDGSLEILNKGKSIVYVYKDKPNDVILEEFKEIIRQKLHLHSKKDIYNNQHIWINDQNELNILTQKDDWKKIRNKNMRYFLIMKYAIHLKNIHGLNWKLANILFKTITDALFVIHTHKSVDIVMENGVILNIKDIIITDKNIIHNIRNDSDFFSNKKEKKDIKLTLWDKYLNNIKKMSSDSKFNNEFLLNKEEEPQIFKTYEIEDDDYEYETVTSN